MKGKGQLSSWRYWFVGCVMLSLPLALVWHLAHLQVIPGEEKGFRFLQSEGEARTLRSERISAYRGVITDRNGELLAVSTPVESLYVNPQRLQKEDIPNIAKSLGLIPEDLEKRLRLYADKQFMYLARHLPPHEAEAILQKKIPGVSSETEFRRYYPASEVAAHVIGFTDINDAGQEGVELAFDSWLAGKSGYKRVVKDLKGNVVKELGLLKAPRSGKELQLSIDLRLQYLAHRELKDAVTRQNAKSGTVVLMDVSSGEILAMVNQPSFNPNNRAKIKAAQLRNRAITDVFEPGSTMKPFAVLAALESGRYVPESKIDTHPGFVRVDKKTFLDPRNYGVMDLTRIIQKSSQVGIIKLALKLEPESVKDVFFRAGFGQVTGIGFPGEAAGSLPNRVRWHPIERATFAFGHGLSVNAVQLARAYNVIANGGTLHDVSLLRGQNSDRGEQVIDSRYTDQILDMLKMVAQPGGTGTRAQIAAYPVAGKSGTAHKVGVAGYVDDKYMAMFAGMAPAKNPKVVAVVVINEPGDGRYFGGEAAAPVFARVVEGALKVLRVPPLDLGADQLSMSDLHL